MQRIIFTTVLVFITALKASTQAPEGYWDFTRAIERTFPLADTDRKWFKVELPSGTTQVIYRVSFLSPNADATDRIANTLSKAPSLTVQGAAMALSVINSLGGTNKCRYHIFLTEDDANNYLNTQNPTNSYYSSAADIPGEKNYFSFGHGERIPADTRALYFAFYNNNYFYDVQVLLEVVPWVDIEASKGWTLEIKNYFMEHCVAGMSEEVTLKKEVCACILDKFQSEHTVQDLATYTEAELENVSTGYAEQCVKGTGEDKHVLDRLRNDAFDAFSKGEYSIAIQKFQELISSGSTNGNDYICLSWCYLFTKQFLKAVKFAKEAEKLDETNLLYKCCLANCYLLNGDVDQAKGIFTKYKTQNVDETTSWYEYVNNSFTELKTKGITCSEYENILNSIKQ